MKDRACGIDVARDSLAATILGEDSKISGKFGVSEDELARLVAWLKENGCTHLVMESTGVFWIPIYTYLEGAEFNLTLANAHQVKAIPGKKTDQADSEWLAYLLRADLIRPSYIREKKLRDLRSLTMLRVELVEDQTAYKNRVHRILQVCNIRLASKLTDIFGKTGTTIINAIINGGSIDEALDRCPGNLKFNKEEIKATIMGTLNQENLLQLKICMELIDTLQEKISRVDAEIAALANPDDVRRISQVPGVRDVSAASIIAEIGNPERFDNEKKNLVQCALAAIKNRNSRLRLYYLKLKSYRGHNIAIIALARKLLITIHHLLLTGEEYAEKTVKPKKLKTIKPSYLKVSIEDALSLLSRAGMLRTDIY